MQPASAAVGLIVVAAGSGSRLGADVPKAFVPLAGVPLLGHAVRGALACPDVAEVVVVAPPGWLDEADAVCRWASSQPDVASARPPSPAGRPSPAQSSEQLSVQSSEQLSRTPVTVVAGGAGRA